MRTWICRVRSKMKNANPTNATNQANKHQMNQQISSKQNANDSIIYNNLNFKLEFRIVQKHFPNYFQCPSSIIDFDHTYHHGSTNSDSANHSTRRIFLYTSHRPPILVTITCSIFTTPFPRFHANFHQPYYESRRFSKIPNQLYLCHAHFPFNHFRSRITIFFHDSARIVILKKYFLNNVFHSGHWILKLNCYFQCFIVTWFMQIYSFACEFAFDITKIIQCTWI